MKVKELNAFIEQLARLYEVAGDAATAKALDKLREVFDPESDLSVAKILEQIRTLNGVTAAK